MKRLFAVAVCVALVAIVQACAPTPHDNSHHSEAAAVTMPPEWQDIKDWLGYNFPDTVPRAPKPPLEDNVSEFLKRVFIAICQLEDMTTLDPQDPERLCPTDPGTGDPDDDDGPPAAPPWQ